MMNGWMKDLALAVRSLRRVPGFTAVAVVTLGLALGANAGIFSVVRTVLLDPLPYGEPERMVYLAGTAPGTDMPEEFRLSMEFLVQYDEQSELLEAVSNYNTFTNTARLDDRVERIWMSWPSTQLWDVLDVQPLLGRLPTAEDEDRVVVISHALWTSWFANDPDVVGRTMWVSNGPKTIVGVMGADFWFPDDRVLLWVSNALDPAGITTAGRFGAPFVARLAPGATMEAVEEELTRLAQRLPERFGGSAAYARIIENFRPVVRPFEEQAVGALARPLWVLLGAVAIVLLIACANVANLFTVRAESRQRDLAVRRAMGAARGQLVRAQMAEALVIAALAGVLAVLIARLGLPLMLRAAPQDLPRLSEVGVSFTTLLFTGGASVAAALLCGLAPALRFSAPGLQRLRESGRGTTHRRSVGRDALVVGQTALALVLLIGSGLLLRSFQQLRQVDPGYEVEDVFTFQVAPEDYISDAPSAAAFHLDLMERIAALPGVRSVGVVENVPLNEGTGSARYLTESMAVGEDVGAQLNVTWAGGDYFGTMGIELLRGRTFTRPDHVSEPGNAILSRSAAEALWPGENPIGKRFRPSHQEQWETVVGVVEDVMQYGFRDTPQPLVYLPLVGQTPTSWVISSPAYVVKTARADGIAPEIRALVREVAPMAPMYRVYTMEGLAADSMVQLSFTMLTLGIAALLALLLGTIGLYGVLSYVVAQRTREIGVRMALGAEASRVRRMVVAQGARVIVAGVVLGAFVALLTSRVLGKLLFGVGAVDVTTFLVMSAIMMLVGLLASWVPARRASSVDPIESLRADLG